jgi:hypothetical protein
MFCLLHVKCDGGKSALQVELRIKSLALTHLMTHYINSARGIHIIGTVKILVLSSGI